MINTELMTNVLIEIQALGKFSIAKSKFSKIKVKFSIAKSKIKLYHI